MIKQTAVIVLVVLLVIGPGPARAHCDTLDGPVVLDAKAALQKGDVTPVLKWVRADDEKEIREAFAKTLKVRGLGDDARDLADHHFFETLVRIHRPGEGVAYTGLDINERFVQEAKHRGINARVFNLRGDRLPLDKYDYVIIQASLYQFIPEHAAVLEKLLSASKSRLIVAEPLRNISSSPCKLLARLAAVASDPGSGPIARRFDEASLDAAVRQLPAAIEKTEWIPGGREKIYLLKKRNDTRSPA